MTKRTKIRTRILFNALWLLVAALAIENWSPMVVQAQDAEVDAFVRTDGSTAPDGFYFRNQDYLSHPTVVPGFSPDFFPLGAPLGPVHKPGSTGTQEVDAIVPGKYLAPGGEPVGNYIVAPYFARTAKVTCSDSSCTPNIDATLYARWGNVAGTITLDDGTPLWFPVTLRASAVGVDGIPKPYRLIFRDRTVAANKSGVFNFSMGAIAPDPLDAQNPAPRYPCPPPPTPGPPNTCVPIPFNAANNWGLAVLGDGGVDKSDTVYISNAPGQLQWTIFPVGFDSQYGVTVTVESSKVVTIQIKVSMQAALKAEAALNSGRPPNQARSNDPDKRPGSPDCPEGCDDHDKTDQCSDAATDNPVSLVTGNVFLDHTDVVLPGTRRDFGFTRSYNSHSVGGGSLGHGWSHALGKKIEELSPQIVRLQGEDGLSRYFSDPGNSGVLGVYGKAFGSSTIQRTSDGYLRTFRTGGSEQYRADGLLASQTDGAGRTTQISYNSDNQISEIVFPEGRRLSMEYSGVLLKRIVSEHGTAADYTYKFLDGMAALTTVLYGDGSGYQYDYDPAGQLTTVSTMDGTVIDRHAYNADGSASWSELNGGRERQTITYGPGQASLVDARGNTSTFQMEKKTSGWFVKSITGCGFCGAQSGTRSWERDDDGRVKSFTDADNNTTKFDYDGPNLSKITDPVGRVTTFQNHDDFGRPGTIIKTGHGTTYLTYTPEGIASRQLPGGQTTHYSYQAGHLQSIRTQSGLTFNFDINDRGEIQSVTDPRGKTISYVHDGMGRLTATVRPGGVTTTIALDGAGRRSQITRPDGKSMTLTYDKSGRETAFLDVAGRSSQYSYDNYNRLAAKIDPSGHATRFAYDLMSNPVSLTDASGHVSSFEYDSIGRIIKAVDAMKNTEEYSYSAGGLLKSVKDRRGITTTYDYDGVGRLISSTYSDGTPPLRIAYDDEARTAVLDNGDDAVTLTFDTDGRLSSEQSRANSSIVSNTYNDDHQRETLSLDGKVMARYRYESSALVAIQTDSGEIGLSYDDLGRRTRLVLPNGLVTEYSYDSALNALTRLRTSAGSSTISDFVYTYDAVGNRMSKTSPDFTERYGYDSLDRLVSAARSGTNTGQWQFGYDAVGNRISDQNNGVTRALEYDVANRLLSVGAPSTTHVAGRTSEPADVHINGSAARMLANNNFDTDTAAQPGTTTIVSARDSSGNTRTNTYQLPAGIPGTAYTYDANGNLTTKTEGSDIWTYTWNARNELIKIEKNGIEVVRFAYDPLGRRIEKVATGLSTSFTYHGSDVIRELKSDGTVFKYIHGPSVDEPLVSFDAAGAATYYSADGLASIVAATNSAGTVTSTRRYDAYGKPEVGSDQPGFGFTGREWDPETQLYYYRARYYDPTTGRFISEDPIAFAGGVNRYAYALANPVVLSDASGTTIKYGPGLEDFVGMLRRQSSMVDETLRFYELEGHNLLIETGDAGNDIGGQKRAGRFKLTDYAPIYGDDLSSMPKSATVDDYYAHAVDWRLDAVITIDNSMLGLIHIGNDDAVNVMVHEIGHASHAAWGTYGYLKCKDVYENGQVIPWADRDAEKQAEKYLGASGMRRTPPAGTTVLKNRVY
jgi:RHS repeat-associated protein